MKRFLFVVLILLSTKIFAQEVLEKIVAVVDNEIIMKSELDANMMQEAAARNIDPNNAELRKKVLNRLIDDNLLLAKSKIDSLKISEEQVNQYSDNQLAQLTQQYGTREKLETAANMNYEKLKKFLKDEIRKKLMRDQVIEKYFGSVSVNSYEVEQFFNTYKDSLPMVNEKYRISHIFMNPKTGDRIQKMAKDFAQLLLDSLKKGADFETLAKRHSQDASAPSGGDLGSLKRGVSVPEFEAAAFALAPNQISEVVRTDRGYHIIKLIERKGEMFRCRQILIKPKSDDKNDLETIQFLSDIRDSIMMKKNTFDYYARKYSDDKNSSRNGGELGTFESSQLEKQMIEQLVKMKDGEVGFAKRFDIGNEYGFHLMKLIKKVPQHKADLELDFDEIKNLAIQKKKSDMLVNFVAELRKNVFWEIRL